MLKIADGRKHFWQWDLNQKLLVEYENVCHVHFEDPDGDVALTVEAYELDGKKMAGVPNILLQKPQTIHAYVYRCESDECTIEHTYFNVHERQRPADYVYTETEVKRWETLEERIEALEQAGGGGGIVQETDPTVPEWAKQPEKPTYTAEEVGAATKESVDKLSEEIEELKKPSEGVTITKSGVVVTIDDCAEGAGITVEGDATETVTLVQNSKNLAPNAVGLDELKFSEVTYSINNNGTITLNGTATRDCSLYFNHPTVGDNRNIWLPAGTYCFHTDFPHEPGFVMRAWDGENTTGDGTYLVANSNVDRPKWFTLTKPTWASLLMNILKDTVCDGTYYFQLEMGEEATEYVPHIRNEYTVNYPATVNAIEGENILFDSAGTILTASYTEGGGNGGGLSMAAVNALIDEKLKVNPAPYGIPTLYLTGDTSAMNKDDAVDLAYVYGDISGTASVKWQGSSSLTFPKKNYTIKFDREFEAKEGWGAQKKYCLKANYIDFSHCRNVVSAKLWGQIVAKRSPANATLADCPNYGAVDGFPCCIVLNDKYIGVYTFNIPKDPWMMNMGSGTNECILCADYHVDATKFKAEAALDGTDFELEYVTDEDNAGWVLPSLNNLLRACANSDGLNLDTTIDTMLDWESAIDYYIFIGLIRGNDMIDKNYLLSTYDGTKWFFGAYDIDSTYGLHMMGTHFFAATSDEPEGQMWNMTQIASFSHIFGLIKTHKLDALKARYTQLRQTVMSEDNVAYMLRNFAGQIPKPLLDEDNRVWPTIPNTNVNNVQQIIDWYRIRCAYIDKEIDAM